MGYISINGTLCGDVDVDGRGMVPVSPSYMPAVGDVSGGAALFSVQSSQGRG